MDHYWMDVQIEKWFDYADVYKSMVDKFDSGVFVEVGAHRGISACCMGVEIINSGKNIELVCVDSWDDDEIFKSFLYNTSPVRRVIKTWKGISWEAAKNFLDNSINFCFIDAAHDYDSVRKDIEAWLPKVKDNGIIAGHDYNPHIGQHNIWVSAVVIEMFGAKNIELVRNVWIYDRGLQK